jgi:hypothetical protein
VINANAKALSNANTSTTAITIHTNLAAVVMRTRYARTASGKPTPNDHIPANCTAAPAG